MKCRQSNCTFRTDPLASVSCLHKRCPPTIGHPRGTENAPCKAKNPLSYCQRTQQVSKLHLIPPLPVTRRAEEDSCVPTHTEKNQEDILPLVSVTTMVIVVLLVHCSRCCPVCSSLPSCSDDKRRLGGATAVTRRESGGECRHPSNVTEAVDSRSAN